MPDLLLFGSFLAMQRLIAFAVLLQTIEFLQMQPAFAPSGVWSWGVIRRDLADWPRPLRALVDQLLGHPGFVLLLWLRLAGAVVCLFLDIPAVWVALAVITLLGNLRWRGTFNGGSDYMTTIVLVAIAAAELVNGVYPKARLIALSYVACQVLLSYFVAGLVKLRGPRWRSGEALGAFLRSDYYGVPASWRAKAWLQRPSVIRAGAWAVIALECLFPMALLDPRLCLVLIALAVLFQSMNAYLFGLNRFLWAWAAGYPALYACSFYWRGRS